MSGRSHLTRWAVLLVTILSVAACAGGRISYSPLPHVRVSVPVHLPASTRSRRGSASLPDGRGAHHKTGRPYRVNGRTYYPLSSARHYQATGTASWYGRKFHGHKTANGEYYDMHALSAAHKTLPLPTMVRVTNLENGRQVIVRVNDRGPFVKNRLIDLSFAAAQELGYASRGTTRVRVESLDGRPVASTHRRARPKVTPAPITTIRPPAKQARSSAGMYIQMGAFSSRANAVGLESSLKPNYPNLQIKTLMRSMQTLYRVRIGPFNDIQNIERTVLTLKQDGYKNIVVVIE